MIEKHNYYNKSLKPLANSLRHQMTKAEACLWKYALSRKQMYGYTFNRQRPVMNYIADFMCKELKLIIEVDGATHHWDETLVKDKTKDEKLKEVGFTVLRFKDEIVLNDLDVVKKIIEETISALQQTKTIQYPPPSSPSQRGTKKPIPLTERDKNQPSPPHRGAFKPNYPPHRGGRRRKRQ